MLRRSTMNQETALWRLGSVILTLLILGFEPAR